MPLRAEWDEGERLGKPVNRAEEDSECRVSADSMVAADAEEPQFDARAQDENAA